MLRPNRLKRIMQEGGTALGCSLNGARDPGTVYCLASAGVDVVFIDLEHNSLNPETVFDLIAHSKAAGVTAMVRPATVDYAQITHLVDAGCQALLLPNLRDPSEVAALLAMARYHPRGSRGVALLGGANTDYRKVTDARAAMDWANDDLLVGLVIETSAAVERLDEMLQPGIDFAVIGYGDLAQSYGVPGETSDARVVSADRQLQQACKQHGIGYGVFEYSADALPTVMSRQPALVMHGGVFQYIRAGIERARVHVPPADLTDA